MRCDAEPVATVSLRYSAREVAIGDLLAERDRNLLDLCRDHVERLTPPVGWAVRDTRDTRRADLPADEPALAV
jgi:Protein of unknown function (DUF3499)